MAAPIISDTHRGAVFVYDPATDDYTIDSERTDGPETGVRFVIVLDYRASLDHNENRGALTVRGFLRGDGVRLDFDIEAAGTDDGERETLDVAFVIGVDARSSEGMIDGTFFLNGDIFATAFLEDLLDPVDELVIPGIIL